MYLYERLFALIIYLIAFIMIFFLLRNMRRKNAKYLLGIYLVFLVFVSYLFYPASGADLYRLIPQMQIWAKYPLSEIVNYSASVSNPTYVLFAYLIGQLNNPNLLPAMTALIFYGISFYIIYGFSNFFKIS